VFFFFSVIEKYILSTQNKEKKMQEGIE